MHALLQLFVLVVILDFLAVLHPRVVSIVLAIGDAVVRVVESLRRRGTREFVVAFDVVLSVLVAGSSITVVDVVDL